MSQIAYADLPQSDVEGKDNFVLIDEVQICPDFELTINSIHASEQ